MSLTPRVPEEISLGDFCNAVRVLPGQREDHYFLDFLLCTLEGGGKLVSRVEVHQDLAHKMVETLEDFVADLDPVGKVGKSKR